MTSRLGLHYKPFCLSRGQNSSIFLKTSKTLALTAWCVLFVRAWPPKRATPALEAADLLPFPRHCLEARPRPAGGFSREDLAGHVGRRRPGPGGPRGCCRTACHPRRGAGRLTEERTRLTAAFQCVLRPFQFPDKLSLKSASFDLSWFVTEIFRESHPRPPTLTHTHKCVAAKCMFALSYSV